MYIQRLLFFVVLLFSFTSDALEDVNLDLVVIFHTRVEPRETTEEKKAEEEKILDALKNRVLPELPKIFKLGQEKTRITVMKATMVSGRDEWSPYPDLHLTEDEATYKRGIAKIQHSETNQNLGRAFKAIREKVFTDRPGLILIFARRARRSHTYCCSLDTERSMVKSEAETMRKDRPIWIIVIAEYDTQTFGIEFKEMLKEKDGLITEKMENITVTTLKRTKDMIDQYLCAHDQFNCFYSDAARSKCVWMSWTPYVPIHSGQCPGQTSKQPPATPCTFNQCEQMCDDRWPWSSTKPDCSKSTCGVSIPRKGTYAWKELQYCPAVYECPCSIAATKTTTTTDSIRASDRISTSMKSTRKARVPSTPPWVCAAIVISIIGAGIIIAAIMLIVYKRKSKGNLDYYIVRAAHTDYSSAASKVGSSAASTATGSKTGSSAGSTATLQSQPQRTFPRKKARPLSSISEKRGMVLPASLKSQSTLPSRKKQSRGTLPSRSAPPDQKLSQSQKNRSPGTSQRQLKTQPLVASLRTQPLSAPTPSRQRQISPNAKKSISAMKSQKLIVKKL